MKLIKENENKAVITTKYIVENQSIITSVYYDEDGDWQFLGDEDITEEDAFVVSVKQILDIDPTLKNIPEIQLGQTIVRTNKNSLWQTV